jgi:hypothetical protein
MNESRLDVSEQVHDEIIHVSVLGRILVQSEQRARKDLNLLSLSGLVLFEELFHSLSLFGRFFLLFVFGTVEANASGC